MHIPHLECSQERADRINSLTDSDKPTKGVNNNGQYAFQLMPSRVLFSKERIAYIDAEDPNRCLPQ